MPDVVRETLGTQPWEAGPEAEYGPVEDVPVAELAWLLDLPLWGSGGRPFQVTPNQVAADRRRFAGHFARVMWADLEDPIRLDERNGRLVVLDGYHRLLKAVVEGRQTIRAVRRHK